MALWGLLGKRPRMQGDPILEQLAEHLAAMAYGDGELPAGGLGGQRDRFIRATPLARAVDVICALSAQMICNGGLSVRDNMDNPVDNRRTKAILELLTHSPDGGITPAYSFVEDAMADYLLDGNALVVPTLAGSTMTPRMLTRYLPHGAYTVEGDGPLVYRAMRAHDPTGTLASIPARDMMHARWPLKERGHTGENNRERFAVAPVALFAQALTTAILQDGYVEKRFRRAPLSLLAVNYDLEKAPNVTPEQRQELQGVIAKLLQTSSAFVGFNADTSEISASPVHEHVTAAQQFQVQTVARIYGLPLPILSAPIGQWTRGVNEQVMKMAWRTGVSVHLYRFLAALRTRLLMPGEHFAVDPTEFVRGDASGISEMLMASQGDSQRDPVASREELRHMMGLPRQPDGEITSTMKVETPGSME